MRQPLIERIIWWWCDTFGHRAPESSEDYWQFDGRINYNCPRCGRIVSRPAAAKEDE